jgi:hypothetical protein
VTATHQRPRESEPTLTTENEEATTVTVTISSGHVAIESSLRIGHLRLLLSGDEARKMASTLISAAYRLDVAAYERDKANAI